MPFIDSRPIGGKIAAMRCIVGYHGGAYHPWESLPSMDGRPTSMDGRTPRVGCNMYMRRYRIYCN